MFSYSPNFYQERLQRLVVRCIFICRAVIRHLQRSKLTCDMMVMKAVTAWCCRIRSAAPEIQFSTEQRGSILYSFLLYPLHKIFSHLQNKKVRNNVFLYIKIDFWHGRSRPVMAFIPDNISVHVNLSAKKTKMAAVSWLIFYKNNKSVSAKIITGLSLLILSAEKGQNFFKLWCSF